MADTKDVRDKQAQDQDRRQRLRALDEALDRADEPEPGSSRGTLNDAVENHVYPATKEGLMEDLGHRAVETPDGGKTLDELFGSVEAETYDSPGAVQDRILELIDAP